MLPSKCFTFTYFGCVVYVPIVPPQYSKLGSQCRLNMYVGFNSPFIIHYLELLTGDVFIDFFINCHFDENVFPSLRRGKSTTELLYCIKILSLFMYQLWLRKTRERVTTTFVVLRVLSSGTGLWK